MSTNIKRIFLMPPCSGRKMLKKLGLTCEKAKKVQFYYGSKDSVALRYKKEDDRYHVATEEKAGTIQHEDETEIDKDIFDSAKNGKNVISMLRCRFTLKKSDYTLCEFREKLKGLILLEKEFDSQDNANTFKLPEPLSRIVLDEMTDYFGVKNPGYRFDKGYPLVSQPIGKLKKQVEKRDNPMSAAFVPEVHPYEKSGHLIRIFLYGLLETIRANRQALLESDTNTERLHQMRVSVRKIRSILELPGLFDRKFAKIIQEGSKKFAQRSNRLRDLDVALERIARYRELLPSKLDGGLDKIAKHLHGERRVEVEAFSAFLGKKKSIEFLDELEFAVLDIHNGIISSSFRDLPAIVLAKSIMKRPFEKALEHGASIDKKSSDKHYHKARIVFKQLRYSMELFSSVFERKHYDRMHNAVKEIQSILGDHHDMTMQIQELESCAGNQALCNKQTKMAIEFLVHTLDKEKEKEKKRFRRNFLEFISKKEDFHLMECRI